LPLTSEDLLLLLNSKTTQLFIIRDRRENRIGLIKAYNINTLSKRANLAFTMLPSGNNTKLMQEAAEIVLERLFSKTGITKVYLQCLNRELEYKVVLTKLLFKKEGELKEHLFRQGKYYNLEIFGLSKEDYYR